MLEYKEYIEAVCRFRSFSKAAQELHVSQPWLSSAIKKTEQELGVLLFDRSTAPVSLTEAGRYYLQETEKIDLIENEMRQHFSQMRADTNSTLHIGSSMFFCTYVLPSLLADFRAQYPQVTLVFREGSTAALTEKLLKGELDLMFEVENVENKQLLTVPWASEEIVLAVPASYPVNRRLDGYGYGFDDFLKRNEKGGRKPSVPLEAFKEQPFLLLNEENDIHQRSLQICRNAGFEPQIKLLLSQMMTAYYLVCEGQGVSFLRSTIPEYVAPTESIVFYQLDDPLAVRSIYLTYAKNGTSEMCRRLIDSVLKR
jgi:DNA-binding transcriptional LysR family regulator